MQAESRRFTMLSTTVDMRQYPHHFVREFIETYRSLPALWKIRCKDYTDRSAKAKAYEKLVAKLREVDPLANRDTVKRKINSMRTTFRKEWRKVQSSRCQGSSGESVYKPSLWYYDLLLFLCDQHYNLEESPSSSPGQEAPVVIESVYKQEFEEDEEFLDDNSQEYAHETSNWNTSQESVAEWPTTRHPTPPSSVSLPAQQLEVKEESIKLTTGLNVCAEDEFDCIGKTWAIKLRRMSATQRLFAERLVNNVLFEGELGTLNRGSLLVVEPKKD